jgi:hypothetical protein
MTYTEIYKQILESVKKDGYPENAQVIAAKNVTDALWQMHILFNSPKSVVSVNTLNTIKDIIENRFNEPIKFG